MNIEKPINNQRTRTITLDEVRAMYQDEALCALLSGRSITTEQGVVKLRSVVNQPVSG